MYGHLNVKEKGRTYDNYTVIVSLYHCVVMSLCPCDSSEGRHLK